MSPLDRALYLSEAYVLADVVATPDRVTADSRVVRGGWDVVSCGVVVAHVDLDGEVVEFSTRRAS